MEHNKGPSKSTFTNRADFSAELSLILYAIIPQFVRILSVNVPQVSIKSNGSCPQHLKDIVQIPGYGIYIDAEPF